MIEFDKEAVGKVIRNFDYDKPKAKIFNLPNLKHITPNSIRALYWHYVSMREKLKELNRELRVVRGIEVESVKVKEKLGSALSVGERERAKGR